MSSSQPCRHPPSWRTIHPYLSVFTPLCVSTLDQTKESTDLTFGSLPHVGVSKRIFFKKLPLTAKKLKRIAHPDFYLIFWINLIILVAWNMNSNFNCYAKNDGFNFLHTHSHCIIKKNIICTPPRTLNSKVLLSSSHFEFQGDISAKKRPSLKKPTPPMVFEIKTRHFSMDQHCN